MANSHPAYPEENAHLIDTLSTVNKLERASEKRALEAKEAIIENSGVKAMRGSSVISHWYLKRAKELADSYESIRKEAYHGRVDFSLINSAEVSTIYIGKRCLFDENRSVLIVDWREPINELFMWGAGGSSSYTDNLGNRVLCNIYLKRHVKVRGKDVVAISDDFRAEGYGTIETAASDPYLLQILKQASSSRLRDVVATIQQEQNEIIRAPLDKMLVVQGVAGSGKTTVVLHRLAYLLYAHRKQILPEQVLVIAPNKVFLSYISEVLPELGYKTITQFTFEDFLLAVVNQKVKVRARDNQYATLLSATPTEPPEEIFLTLSALACKGRLAFINVLDQAIAAAVESAIPKSNLVVDGQVLLTLPQMLHLFNHDYPHLTLAQRIDELRAVAEKSVQKYVLEKGNKLNEDFAPLLDHARRATHRHKQQWLERIIKERDALLADLRTAAKESWEAYRALFRTLDSVRIYRQLLSSIHLLLTYNQGRQPLNEICALAIRNQTPGSQGWDREDLACLAYIAFKVKGFSHSYKYVAIDEGQDLTPLEFHILHAIIGHSAMTIVGDINQSFYPARLLPSWQDLLSGTIAGDKYVMVRLSSSYRTTEQIATLANSVLQSPHFARHELIPIPRSGPVPAIEKFDSAAERLARISGLMRELAIKHKNISIVTRTLPEAEELHTSLKAQGIEVALIGAETQNYSGGLHVMPVNMAKGLELDVVIVSNASGAQYPDEQLSARLFYVAITRAMHELYAYCDGALTPLLERYLQKETGSQAVPLALTEVAATIEVAPDPAVSSPGPSSRPALESPKPLERIYSIDKWLVGQNCRIRYDSRGSLWIVGGLEHKDLMKEAANSGYRFVYLHRGAPVTGNKPGWMLERKR